MTPAGGALVHEAVHVASLTAPREQILAAELDVEWCARVFGYRLTDLVRDDAGLPQTWTLTTRLGVVRSTFDCALMGTDPVATRAADEPRLVETCTTTVSSVPDADGRWRVEWRLVAEITATGSVERWFVRRASAWQRRSLQRQFTRMMTRWCDAIEAYAAAASRN